MVENHSVPLSHGFVSTAADAMLVTDGQGRILVWNAAAEELLGYPADYAIGRPMDFIVPDAMRGEHSAGMERLNAGGAPRLIGKPVEVHAKRADGSLVPIELRITTWQDGATYFGAVIREITTRKENEELLHSLAHFDQLTMLANRGQFLSNVDKMLAKVPAAVLLIVNFDKFAEVNDRLGSGEADEILREAALCFKRFAGQTESLVGRLGANEFGVCLPDVEGAPSAAVAATKLRDELSGLNGSDGRGVTASIGVAVAPEHGGSSGKLTANADFAVRRAKHNGGDRWHLFQPHQRELVRARRDLELTLEAAWEAGEFEVHYQPQVSLGDKSILGAEALLRWRHASQGLILPGLFMHAMQGSKLAERVGDYVVEDACRQAAAWRDQTGRDIRVGVNLFERQFLRSDQPERIERALSAAGLRPESLELEILETVMTGSDEASILRVQRLREIGVGIAFDDYGTGYASLGLLKRYPITTLKIDRSFISELNRDRTDLTIVELVLTLGRRFGLRVVAEGIETQEQAEVLLALGCEEAQGYLFGKPAPAEAITTALGARHVNGSGAMVA